MTSVIVRPLRARKKPDGWHHPITGDVINQSEEDVFVMDLYDPDQDKILATLTLDRPGMEHIGYGIERTLSMDPVIIKCR